MTGELTSITLLIHKMNHNASQCNFLFRFNWVVLAKKEIVRRPLK